jgi:RNA binding exosome subunit
VVAPNFPENQCRVAASKRAIAVGPPRRKRRVAEGRRWRKGHDGHGCDAGAERAGVKKINCQEVLDHLSDYLEEDVAAELRTQIEAHLNGCRHCHLEVDTLQRTVQLYRADDIVGTPIILSERIKSALAAAYREKGCADCD